MSKVKRFPVPLLFVLLLSVGCATGPAARDFGPCAAELAPNPNAPVVFVRADGEGNPMVSPDPVRANDRFEHDRTRPVMIQWHARPGDALRVRMAQDGCVEDPVCRDFRCYAFTRVQESREERSCKYDVTLNGRTLDPVVIIQPCCM